MKDNGEEYVLIREEKKKKKTTVIVNNLTRELHISGRVQKNKRISVVRFLFPPYAIENERKQERYL